MTKILENIILEEINAAFVDLVKTNRAIQEEVQGELPMADPLASDPNLNSDPLASPDADLGSLDSEAPLSPEEENAEEDKDPVDASFDELKELSDKTEDITKIVKTIKANAQSKFEGLNDPALIQLINKINDEGTILMKTALNTRPELADLKSLIKTSDKEVINPGDTMRIRESEIKKLAEKIAEAKLQKLNENADFSATEVIMHIAAKMVMDLKRDIVKEFNLIHPDKMSPEVQDSFKNITGEMQTKIAHAIGETLEKLQKFPRVQEENKPV